MQFWCLGISAVLLMAFLVVTLVERSARYLCEMQRWKLRVGRFALLVLSAGALLFGWEFYDDLSFRGVAESLYRAVKLFFADGTMYEAENPPLSPDHWLSVTYFILYYLICGIAVYCTAAAVISIFKNFAALRELDRRGRRKNLCVFSELNEKTLAIAQSLLENTKEGAVIHGDGFFTRPVHELDDRENKLAFVFCDVFEHNAELHYEQLNAARNLGALCLKNDITEVHERLRRAGSYRGSDTRIFRYFLAGADEAENVRQAIVIADTERMAPTKTRIKNLAIFAIATGDVNGKTLDALNETSETRATYFVRRLHPAIMLAYHIIPDPNNRLITKADPERDLHVVVAGMGQYGEEFVKMLAWFYQRRRGGITIHVVDRQIGLKDSMRAKCPSLVDGVWPTDPTEDTCVKLVFHEGVDLFTGTFDGLVRREFAHIDAAFITLGDDDLNAQAATRLRLLLDRVHYEDIAQKTGNYVVWDGDTPIDRVPIFAVVHDNKRCKNFVVSAPNSGVRFVGADNELYTYKNLYDRQREVDAVNEHRSKKRLGGIEGAVNAYNASEYNRLSSLALTHYNEFYAWLYGDDTADEQSREKDLRASSKRWNTYMRACGYMSFERNMPIAERERLFVEHNTNPSAALPRRQWQRGKWHNGIVPFSFKGSMEQNNGKQGQAKHQDKDG